MFSLQKVEWGVFLCCGAMYESDFEWGVSKLNEAGLERGL